MYKDKTICVVVPAYNEEKLIGKVIESMPGWVDKIVIVDDRSKDKTVEIVKNYSEKLGERVILIQHQKNQGVGGAIITGYKWARDNKINITAVMAGDAQMDPEDLPKILEPVASGEIDYAKGNRLFTGGAWKIIPKVRYFGNSSLSLLTKIASGYWHVADSQTGYTATSLKVLQTLDLDKIYKRYGMPNDMLVRLNAANFSVRDVPIKPIYNIGEISRIKLIKVIPTLSLLLLKRFFWRLKEKYIIRDFHPLIFFYLLAFLLLGASLPLFIRLIYFWVTEGTIPPINALAWMFSISIGLQSLFFAMWFDMEYNKGLK